MSVGYFADFWKRRGIEGDLVKMMGEFCTKNESRSEKYENDNRKMAGKGAERFRRGTGRMEVMKAGRKKAERLERALFKGN